MGEVVMVMAVVALEARTVMVKTAAVGKVRVHVAEAARVVHAAGVVEETAVTGALVAAVMAGVAAMAQEMPEVTSASEVDSTATWDLEEEMKVAE